MGATFVDGGYGFRQEIRYIVSRENVPSGLLYGFDIKLSFIELGYKLIRDRTSLHTTLTYGDLAAPLKSSTNINLAKREALMDIVYVSSALHLWA